MPVTPGLDEAWWRGTWVSAGLQPPGSVTQRRTFEYSRLAISCKSRHQHRPPRTALTASAHGTHRRRTYNPALAAQACARRTTIAPPIAHLRA